MPESSSLQQLRELVRTDAALRQALAGAADAAELQSIGQQRGISLSADEAQQWLATEVASADGLSPEALNAISEGLSLTDEDLDGIAGGETGGEAIVVGL